jgi:hypothetical protein
MPTILRWNGYRFHFFSNEGNEPPHIHVTRAGNTAKFWLADGNLAYNDGFKHNELRDIVSGVLEHKALLLEAWNKRNG